MKLSMPGRSLLGACVVAAFAGCGGAQTRLALFSTDWEDDGGASIARVWQRLGGTKVTPSTDVVVGVTGSGDTLVGLPLASGSKWTFVHPLDVRPVVAGTVVVGSGAGETFALDAGSGRLLWKESTAGYTVLGAGDDGAVTVLTLARTVHSAGSASELVAVGHDGKVVRQISTSRALGAPAVLGSMAFVPWAGEYVSVIDLGSGDEVARVTVRAETSRAWTSQGALWFGEVGFIRFDEHISDASRGRASMATPPIRELPGVRRLMPPGGVPVPLLATAEDKARIYARPAAMGPGVTMEDGRWYATYFRIAMGYDAGLGADAASGETSGAARASDAGKLAWVHLHAVDFVGGAAGAGGIVLCDERGQITSLDARTGAVLAEAELGEPVKACVVNVDGQRVAGGDSEAKPLAEQLAAAVLVEDPQLVVVQRLLLRELAAQEDETATRALVDLASSPRTSPDLLADSRTALANRRNGASYMETALLRHYDFLRDVLRAPPVGPIAQALGAMKEKTAAPLLAAHLLDPADTDDDVMRAAAALAVLAGPGEAPALREFFSMYRATAANDDVAAAVVSVGQALMVVDDKEGRTKVESAAADASTVPYARDRLEALVSAAKQMAAGSAGDAEPGGKKGK
jgi:outer membrane protein assembly factor BamB